VQEDLLRPSAFASKLNEGLIFSEALKSLFIEDSQLCAAFILTGSNAGSLQSFGSRVYLMRESQPVSP
jgi:hypothetical protein